MTLDRPLSDAELLERWRRQNPGREPDGTPSDAELLRRVGGQGVTLGPNSPLRDDVVRVEHKRRAPGRKTRQRESAIQVALFRRIDDLDEQRKRPELGLVFAVPNGGQRRPAVAAKLKAEGVRPGVLDVWCPVARGGYHGLVVEMKTPDGSLSPEQIHWLAALDRQGWKTAVHVSDFDAWAELLHYLDSPHPSRK